MAAAAKDVGAVVDADTTRPDTVPMHRAAEEQDEHTTLRKHAAHRLLLLLLLLGLASPVTSPPSFALPQLPRLHVQQQQEQEEEEDVAEDADTTRLVLRHLLALARLLAELSQTPFGSSLVPIKS